MISFLLVFGQQFLIALALKCLMLLFGITDIRIFSFVVYILWSIFSIKNNAHWVNSLVGGVAVVAITILFNVKYFAPLVFVTLSTLAYISYKMWKKIELKLVLQEQIDFLAAEFAKELDKEENRDLTEEEIFNKIFQKVGVNDREDD